METEGTPVEGIPTEGTPTEGAPSGEGEALVIETGPTGTAEETPTVLPSDEGEFVMPEKFKGKTAEEIAKIYVELEKFKGEGKPAEEPPKTEEPPVDDGMKYLKEFNETGGLSDESYKELEEKGFSKEDVDERLEYEKYKTQKKVDEMAKVVGGIEEYNAMEEWASEAKTEEERKQFVEEFQASGDMARKALLKTMYSEYTAAKEGGDVIHTNEPQVVKGSGYQSQHELQTDMADRRYGNDRSYTQMVEAKLARSNLDKLV